MSTHLSPHNVALAVIAPQIAANTGNIARTCVATGTALHLVRPMGFVLEDKHLRRSALDYWPRLRLSVHDDVEAFLHAMAGRRLWWFDSAGATSLFEAAFVDGDMLVLGSETRGIDPAILARAGKMSVAIPQAPGERCMNLASSAGIALFAALSRVDRRRGAGGAGG